MAHAEHQAKIADNKMTLYQRDDVRDGVWQAPCIYCRGISDAMAVHAQVGQRHQEPKCGEGPTATDDA